MHTKTDCVCWLCVCVWDVLVSSQAQVMSHFDGNSDQLLNHIEFACFHQFVIEKDALGG